VSSDEAVALGSYSCRQLEERSLRDELRVVTSVRVMALQPQAFSDHQPDFVLEQIIINNICTRFLFDDAAIASRECIFQDVCLTCARSQTAPRLP
jgi:hypothetical protein